MDRRRFLSLLGLGAAGLALDQAIPLGRVWSFPSKIIAPTADQLFRVTGVQPDLVLGTGNIFLTTEFVSKETLRLLRKNLQFQNWMKPVALFPAAGPLEVGDIISIATPVRRPVRRRYTS